MLRRAAGVAVALLIVAVLFVAFGSGYVARTFLTPELVVRVLNRALGPASDGLYVVEVGAVEARAVTGSLHVADVVLRPLPERVAELRQAGRLPAVRGHLSVASIALDGTNLISLVMGHALEASALVVERPRLTLRIAEGVEAAGAPTRAPSPDGSGLTRVALDRVVLVDASLEALVEPREAGARPRPLIERLDGLDLELEGVRIDPTEGRGLARIAFADDVSFDIDRLVVPLGDDRYRLELRDAAVSTSAASVRLGHVGYEPRRTREQYLQSREPLGDRLSLSAGPIAIAGLQFDRLARDLDLVAERMTVEGLSVDILVDRHKPARPASGPPGMPHDVFRDSKRRLSLDELRVNAGRLRFAERARDAAEPGQIRFDSVTVVGRNINNDPTRMSRRRPATARVRALFMSAAPVDLRFRIPLLEPGPTMRYSGRVGALDAHRLNEISVPLVGVRLAEGRIDRVEIDVDVGVQRARGEVTAVYRDLQLQLVDKVTGGRSLGQRLKSFVMGFGVHSSNVAAPGEPPRAGRVDYRVEPDAAFFKTFWKALESGLMDGVRK